MDRIYLPCLFVEDLQMAPDQFAETLKRDAYLSGRAPAEIGHLTMKDPETGMDVIGFPMREAAFLQIGLPLLLWLHETAAPHRANSGNEFLCVHMDGNRTPAEGLWAGLLATDDGGKTWFDFAKVTLEDTRTTSAN